MRCAYHGSNTQYYLDCEEAYDRKWCHPCPHTRETKESWVCVKVVEGSKAVTLGNGVLARCNVEPRFRFTLSGRATFASSPASVRSPF